MDQTTPEAPQRRMRKTRFVCISDTHNASPKDGCFQLPPGDVLIHAGDLSNQGTLGELRQTIEWIAAADYEVKIVVAGNHDITLDAPYYANNAERFHNHYPQNAADCMALMHKHPSIIYLQHESRSVRLARPSGPKTEFRVFGSPYSPGNGQWAFGYAPKTGVAITGSRDRTASSAAGTSRPGATSNIEHGGNDGDDNGDKDGVEDDDGDSEGPRSHAGLLPGTWLAIPDDADVVVTHTPARGRCDAGRADRSCRHLGRALQRVRPRLALCGHVHEGWGAEMVTWKEGDGSADVAASSSSSSVAVDLPRTGRKLAKIDLAPRKGRKSLAGLTDDPGLSADSTRQTTCVVNAAIKARSRGQGGDGPMYNKPIVVDICLPTWCPD